MIDSDPVFGRPDRSDWRSYQVKGNLLAARPRYVREQWGPTGVEEVISRLDGEARASFSTTILPFAWYPFSTMAAIDRAIVEGPMKADVKKMKDFGSTIARYDLPTLYKVLFKLGSPSFLLKRISTVYATYIRGGSVAVTVVGDQKAIVTQAQGSLPYYFCSQGVPGWFSAAIELSGGKDIHVREIQCTHEDAERCRWEATWR
jgi:uncharacterized protein (TIGR02265 family)